MKNTYNMLILFIFSSCLLLVGSCSTTRHSTPDDGLPILTKDELIRPYVKLGRIQVTREVFVTDYTVSSDITAWGFAAVRNEAQKMGADAVILLEVTGHSITTGVIPSTEYRATGFAIKFK
ncbi:MAG: hypothetical protein PHY09_13380 [Desulfuromonadaceae bacterium]|nr:hypothetical protein [Desulfuromonadaceae bacterium]MDD5107373.1 hypothetical protein [Desulfuromonadaceae bacterium]